MIEASGLDLTVDPRTLGLRLQVARKSRRLTQHDAAEALEMSRPTYTAIEKGERTIQPRELIRLAELFGRSVHELLRQRPPIRDFVAYFRSLAVESYETNPELDEAATLLQRLCENYLELEEQRHSPLPRNYPAPYDVSERDPVERAEEVADQERMRLGLGDGPIVNLRDILETDVGLRIFSIGLPSRISGLFIFTEELGGCIAIQQNHPPERRLWSLCHEYAHFLVHRYEPEVTLLRSDRRRSRKERFADAFARTFLMPELSLRRRFYSLTRSVEKVTPAGLIGLADFYGVSFEALLLRLEDLRLIPIGTWLGLKELNFRVNDAQQLLGPRRHTAEQKLPHHYTGLAVGAYLEGELTEAELMEFLLADRQQTRRIVWKVTRRASVTDEGESGQLFLDLEEALCAPKSSN